MILARRAAVDRGALRASPSTSAALLLAGDDLGPRGRVRGGGISSESTAARGRRGRVRPARAPAAATGDEQRRAKHGGDEGDESGEPAHRRSYPSAVSFTAGRPAWGRFPQTGQSGSGTTVFAVDLHRPQVVDVFDALGRRASPGRSAGA